MPKKSIIATIIIVSLFSLTIFYIKMSYLRAFEFKKEILINLINHAPINVCNQVLKKYEKEIALIDGHILRWHRSDHDESYNYASLHSINILFNSKNQYEFCFSDKYKKNYNLYDYSFRRTESFLFQSNIKNDSCENPVELTSQYSFCLESEKIINRN